MKKEETSITLANGGMHNQEQYKLMKDMLDTHSYMRARLYHLVMMNSNQVSPYQAALKAIVRKLKLNKIDCKWKACIEIDEVKGLHMHVFILCEAFYFDSGKILNHSPSDKNGWLLEMMQKRELTYKIAAPTSPLHWSKAGKQLQYARLNTPERLADCKLWISYLVKKRSKPEDIAQIYFSSRSK
jgi:hypothetical protein